MTKLEQLQAQAQLYGFSIAALPARPGQVAQFHLTRAQAASSAVLYRGTLPQLRARLKELQFARDCFLCP
jgi:hypothetical protein